MISYAQCHEDVILWRALQGVDNGTYVDVGAHDPTDLSVTKAFSDAGWSGINIEPNPSYARKLRTDRPRDVTIEVCLGSKPGMATLYDFGHTGLSTTVAEIADRHRRAGFAAREHRIPVTTLAAVLDDLAGQPVHFLKIDVEGAEGEVLAGADFTRVRPWIVLIESVRPMLPEETQNLWEPLLLSWNYRFVYFDGLNRYYVAGEREDLARYFRVPVSIWDPYRDVETVRLARAVEEAERARDGEADAANRLSRVIADQQYQHLTLSDELRQAQRTIAELEQRGAEKISAVPRSEAGTAVGNAPALEVADFAASAAIGELDVDDAQALVRVVGAQAKRIVELRRDLQASREVAARRLSLVKSQEAQLHSQSERLDAEELDRALVTVENLRAANSQIEAWLRDIVSAEIARVEISIHDIVHLSRWRRTGQRLGLAKTLPWEAGFAPGVKGGGDGRPVAEMLEELRQLWEKLQPLARSRWRQVGQNAGIAKRMPWEAGAWTSPLLGAPIPVVSAAVQHDVARRPAAAAAKVAAARTHDRTTYGAFVEYTSERFLEECRAACVDTILDIGANSGQFARSLRELHYPGHIVSFEPLSDAHAALSEAAKGDPLWEVASRCAIGAEDGWSEINVAGNSYSSSLLPMLDLHANADPRSVYKKTERCQVISLDTFIDGMFSDRTTLFGLKMDTQGFELEVLKGLRTRLDSIRVIVCEMSLSPLYAGAPTMPELCEYIARLGFRCVALAPEFEDPRSGNLLQANGVFVRR